MWLVAEDVDFVHNGKVPKFHLQHERGRIATQSLSPCRGFEQHGFDLPPGHVVPDTDRRVQNQAPRISHRAVIDDFAAQNRGVGNNHFLVLSGAQVRNKKADLLDIANVLPDFHQLANPKRTTIRHAVAGDQVPYERRGTQGEDDSN